MCNAYCSSASWLLKYVLPFFFVFSYTHSDFFSPYSSSPFWMSSSSLITSYSSFVLALYRHISYSVRYLVTASVLHSHLSCYPHRFTLKTPSWTYKLDCQLLFFTPPFLRVRFYLTPLILYCFCVPVECEIDPLLNYSTSMNMYGELEVGTTAPLVAVCFCCLSYSGFFHPSYSVMYSSLLISSFSASTTTTILRLSLASL